MNKQLTLLYGFARKNLIFSVCAVLLLFCSGYYFQRSSLLSDNQEIIVTKSTESKNYKLNLINAAKLAQQLDEITALNKSIFERSMEPNDVSKKFKFFLDIEKSANAKFLDKRDGATTAISKNYLALPYTLSALGSFAEILELLNAVQSGVHFPRFRSVVINSNDESLSMTVTVDFLARP